jgi:hypothetical protein
LGLEVAVCLLLPWAGRSAGGGLPRSGAIPEGVLTLGSVAAYGVPGAVGVLVCVAAVVVLRGVVTRRSLRRRERLYAVPVDSFDPDVEAVLRFAMQLGRTRRSVGGLLDRRARAVRVRLDSVGQGQMLYGLEIPARSRGVVRAAVYPGVELFTAETLERSGILGPNVAVADGPDEEGDVDD